MHHATVTVATLVHIYQSKPKKKQEDSGGPLDESSGKTDTLFLGIVLDSRKDVANSDESWGSRGHVRKLEQLGAVRRSYSAKKVSEVSKVLPLKTTSSMADKQPSFCSRMQPRCLMASKLSRQVDHRKNS